MLHVPSLLFSRNGFNGLTHFRIYIDAIRTEIRWTYQNIPFIVLTHMCYQFDQNITNSIKFLSETKHLLSNKHIARSEKNYLYLLRNNPDTWKSILFHVKFVFICSASFFPHECSVSIHHRFLKHDARFLCTTRRVEREVRGPFGTNWLW